MDDEELIDALRTGLDAVDPPPASLFSKALEAGRWPASGATQAVERDEDELVGAGMRASDTTDEGVEDSVRDLSFEGAGHTIDITIDAEARGAGAVEVTVIITAPVDRITVLSPFGEAQVTELDSNGQATFRPEHRAIAVEFNSASGANVRTPLIRLS